mgnify:CR=1 FL=1
MHKRVASQSVPILVKSSPPRVKTSPSLFIYTLILFIFLSLLFHYNLTTYGLLKKSVIYGHRVLREEQQEKEDYVWCTMMMWCVLCLRKYLFSFHCLYYYVTIYIILLFTFIIILLILVKLYHYWGCHPLPLGTRNTSQLWTCIQNTTLFWTEMQNTNW